MSKGEVPQDLAALSGDWDIQKVIAWSHLDHDDVYQVRTQSGGGYGDPLDRDPARVLEDVRSGVVSVEGAKNMYGVVVDEARDDVDAVFASADRVVKARLRTQRLHACPMEPRAGRALPTCDRRWTASRAVEALLCRGRDSRGCK